MKIVIANSVGMDSGGYLIVHSPSRWTEAVLKQENHFVYYPWELAYLSTLLKRDTDCQVKFIDGCLELLDCTLLAKRICEQTPDVLIMESGSRVYRDNIHVALQVKQNCGTKIVFTGQHASAFPDQTIKDGADAVFIGEYEHSVCNVARQNKPEAFCGVFNRANQLVDIKNLPWPEDDDVRRIDYATPGEPSSEYQEIQMYATRGCPRKCGFCVASNLYYSCPSHRTRSAVDVVDEISHLLARYPQMQGVFFDEESHNANRQFIFELTEEIKHRGLDHLKYEAMCDFAFFDQEMFERMSGAGYYKIRFGIETTNSEIGSKLGKFTPEDKLVQGLEAAHKAGLKTYATFMAGLPGSDRKTDEKTFDFMKRVLDKGILDNAQLSIAIPQPGTPFYSTALEKGFINEMDFSYLDTGRCVVSSPGYPSNQVDYVYAKAVKSRNHSLLVRQIKNPVLMFKALKAKLRKHGFLYTLKKVVSRFMAELS